MKKYVAVILFSLVGCIAMFVADAQESISRTSIQNGYVPIFDHGQRDGSFYQSAGSSFQGVMSMQTNYSYTQPQQTVIYLGYDSTRVEVSNVKCLIQWRCHVSKIDNEFYFTHIINHS